jgi:ankyrin repeat protein
LKRLSSAVVEISGECKVDLRQLKQLIRAGDLDSVRAAIDANPELMHFHDPDEGQWEEKTALHCAARYAQIEIAKFLVERGAEVYSNPMNSYPPIFIADCHRYYDDRPNAQHLVDYFLNEIPHRADGTQQLGVTIHLAARAGWTEVVRKHIQLDPLAVNQRGWLGDTPLHWSCHNGHAEIVTMLLDAGAEIEADELNCYGGKPLHWASEHEPHIVKLLLERGANVNSLNGKQDSKYFGATPLLMNTHMKDDCAAATQLLLEAGADTTVTFRGKTARQLAEENGNLAILRVLDQA